jgi:FkbM family methyltransferase
VLQRLWKPWFVYRPQQLLRRLRSRPVASGMQLLTTSWGYTLEADPTRTIGQSIHATGLYDLAVSEVLARLIKPNDAVVDAGANIGYMSCLAAVLLRSGGRLFSFEPHPQLFKQLQKNLSRLATNSPLELHLNNCALGSEVGVAQLVLPSDFDKNDGIGRIGTATSQEVSIEVPVKRLDQFLGEQLVSVMKLDVEGFELPVLQGATQSISRRRIRTIVFEDHEGPESEVVKWLTAQGYQLFALGWTMRRLQLQPIAQGSLAKSYEAANYIATLVPDEVLKACQPAGWRVLRSLING